VTDGLEIPKMSGIDVFVYYYDCVVGSIRSSSTGVTQLITINL